MIAQLALESGSRWAQEMVLLTALCSGVDLVVRSKEIILSIATIGTLHSFMPFSRPYLPLS
jgi:hypothetical protein